MKVYLSLGSNLGNRLEALQDALHSISAELGSLVSISSVYETEPWGFQAEQAFLNMVVRIESSLSPDFLMQELLKIESVMGRKRMERGYASRLIDLDILLIDDRIINGQLLEVPHPRMHLRRFVLVPLAEIAPDVVHPVQRKSINELLVDCEDHSSIRLFGSGEQLKQYYLKK